jgi:uncharacterized membrane protein
MYAFLNFSNYSSTFFKNKLLMLAAAASSQSDKRLLSLDFMRGLIMVLLAMESTGLYEHLSDASGTTVSYMAFFSSSFITHGMAFASGILYNPVLCLLRYCYGFFTS